MTIPVAIAYSPKTQTSGVTAIDADVIVINDTVNEGIESFPPASSDAPGEAVLCTIEGFASEDPADYETIRYTERDVASKELRGVTREVEGTAREWPDGTWIASFTSADAWNEMRDTLKSKILEANETVTVGDGGDFGTINEAITYLSEKKPLYTEHGYEAVIELMPGFVMEEQVIAHKINLGYITITSGEPYKEITDYADSDGDTLVTIPGHGYSTGDVVYIKDCGVNTDHYNGGWNVTRIDDDTFKIDCEWRGNPTAKGEAKKGHIIQRSAITEDLDGQIGAFVARQNATLPHLEHVLFKMDTSGSDLEQDGIIMIHNCTCSVRWGGIMHATRRGITFAIGCIASLVYSVFSDAGQIGVRPSNESLCNFQYGIARNCGWRGVAVAGAYCGMAYSDVSLSGERGLQCNTNAVVRAERFRANNCADEAIRVWESSHLTAYEAEAKNAGTYGCRLARGWADLIGTDLSGAGTSGILAERGSHVIVVDGNAQKGESPSRTDIVVETGSTVAASGATGGISQTSGRVTAAGTIFKGNSEIEPFKNKLINGNFDIWQRGTSDSASEDSRYLADRWVVGGVENTLAVSRQEFTIGQTAVPNNPPYYFRAVVDGDSGASNMAMATQRIEDVRTLSGQTATVSFWAKADDNRNMSVELLQNFGSGGSTVVTGIGTKKVALTTAWEKYEVIVDVNSITGKTVGTDSSLNLNFWFTAGSDYDDRTDSLGHQTGTFDIAQVQLEAGCPATPFEQRPIGLELSLCQRYFWKTYNMDVAPGTSSADGRLVWQCGSTHSSFGSGLYVSNPVTMRVPPTVTAYDDSTGSSDQVRNITSDTTECTIENEGERGFILRQPSGPFDEGDIIIAQVAADAEL